MAKYSMAEIHEAVNDPAWQEFRKSLKGLDTEEKLTRLDKYFKKPANRGSHKVCIRVDNYIKALCRGGQLEPGCSLEMAQKEKGIRNLPIRKVR